MTFTKFQFNNFCYWPSNPKKIVEFIGGSYLASKPDLTYKRFIENLINKNIHPNFYLVDVFEGKETIEIEKREFRTRAYSQINRLQGKVEGYTELLLAQDEEIERLKKLNEQLYEENKEQKVEINNLNSTISNINESNQLLEEKIKVAARLELKDIEIIGVFRNGSTKVKSFKNRSLSKIRIDFTLAENELAKIEVLDIYIRVEKPSGDVFFDISKGSGSFTFENRELFYTIKRGVHKVVLYTKNYIIGSSEFLVK